MKKLKHYLNLVAFCIVLTLGQGCKKEILVDSNLKHPSLTSRNLAVTPYTFNWETVDWMPTPPGQSQIPPPWIGQGSIASTYGTDVINDHKASDGWVLVYNTFNPNASGNLVNPYFILYNKYRGLMRIYFYTTTSFISPSTYIVDGLQVVSGKSSSMLSFLGTDLVQFSQNPSSFSQIEPAPIDGSQPLASNKWYMLQYEMAYDPQISTLGYQDIQLSWFMNFNSISTISLGGTETGTVKTATGAPSNALNTALQNGGKVAGTGAAAIIGASVLENNGDPNTGVNKMGLPADSYKSIVKGVLGAVSAAAGGIPGAVVGIFSAIIGGSSSSSTVNLNLNSTITLKGTQTTSGSFPSSPTSVYIPGTNITSAAQNYIPLYNTTLGVFNLSGIPKINCKYVYNYSISEATTTCSLTNDEINGSNIIFNPAVLAIAKIQNIKEEVVLIDPQINYPWTYSTDSQSYYGFYEDTGTGIKQTIGTHIVYSGTSIVAHTQGFGYYETDPNIYIDVPAAEVNYGLGIRISFDVVPNNGAPKSTIVKTFAMGTHAQSIIEQ